MPRKIPTAGRMIPPLPLWPQVDLRTKPDPRIVLTPRQSFVFAAVAAGYSNCEIAAHLAISCRTVETHRDHLMHRLDIHNAVDLTRLALACGFVTFERI